MNNAHDGTKLRREVEELSAIVVDCAYKLHVEAGPGLLESVYKVLLAKMLAEQGLHVSRQVSVPIRLMGLTFKEGFRADPIVEDRLLIELKSVENLLPVHSKQVLTDLRLLKLPLGLLINNGAATFKEGCKRIVNGPQSFTASCEPKSSKGLTFMETTLIHQLTVSFEGHAISDHFVDFNKMVPTCFLRIAG